MSNEVIITDNNFDTEVIGTDMPIFVDFWAPWCGPCKMLGPVVESIADEFAGKIKVGKCNVDENPTASAKYNIRSIPTMIVFKNGQPVKQLVGFQSKDAIIAMFSDLL